MASFAMPTPSTGWGRLIARVVIATVVVVAVAMVVAVLALDLPRADVPLMLQLLAISAIGSLGLGALLLWLSAGRHWNRLGTRLGVAQVFGVLVALINISLTALRMFFSTHDLQLLIFLLGYSLAIALIYSWLVSASLSTGIDAVRTGAVRIAAGDLS